MNPDFPQNERAHMEAKLTALLLGELHADEIAALSKAMEADPELAALYERLKVTVELVREMKPAAEEPAPLKMSAEKREKLLASFKTVTPQEFQKPRRVMDWLVPVAAAVVVLGALVAMLLPKLAGRSAEAHEYAGRYWGKPATASMRAPAPVAVPAQTNGGTENFAYYLDFKPNAGTAPQQQASSAAAPIYSGPIVYGASVAGGGAVAGPVPKEQPSVATPPPASLTTPTPIVLPAERDGDKGGALGPAFAVNENGDISIKYQNGGDISEALKKLSDQQTNAVAMNVWGFDAAKDVKQEAGFGRLNPETVTPGTVMVTNSFALNVDSVALNADSFDTNTKYRMLSQLGTESENEKLNINYKNVTNGSAARSSDQVQVLGDLSELGQALKNDSTVADNEEFRSRLAREDLGGLRYVTNGAVTSQPIAGNALQWGSFDGTTNSPNVGSLGTLAGANTYAGSTVVNNGTLAVAGTTNWVQTLSLDDAAPSNSSRFIARYAYIDKPSSGDGLLTSGLRNTAPTGGVVQAENRGGEIVLPQSTGLADAGVKDESGKQVVWGGGGGGGGGFGGFGGGGRVNQTRSQPAVGGKQVELAAANRPKPQRAPVASAEAKLAEVNSNDSRLGFDWNLGNYMSNGAATASGGSMPEAVKATESQRGAMPSNYALDRAKQIREEDIPTSQMIQDGKLLYQLGRNDEAELKFQQALQKDPNNQSALYYLSLTKQLRDQQLTDSRNVTSMNLMVQVDKGWVDNDARLKLPPQPPRSGSNTAKIAEYAAAKEELERAKLFRETIDLKTKQEVVDVNLPKARMVTIMDKASPAATEKAGLGEKIKETLTGKVERTASIQVDQERPDINVNGVQGNMGSGYDAYFLQTEFETIQSHAVLGKVVKQLNLDGGDASKTQAAEEKLKKNLDLRSVKNTKLIEIGAKSEKPEDAARIANAVADAYRDFRSQEYDELKHAGITNLQQQLQEQDQRVQVAQARVDELGKGFGTVYANSSSESEMVSANQVKALVSAKVQKEAEYNQLKTLAEKLKAMDKAQLRKALPVAYSDTQLNELLSEYDLAQQNLLKLKLDYNPDHPKFKAAQALVNDLDSKINGRVAGIMTELEAKTEYTKSYLVTLQNELAAAEQAQTNTTNEVSEAFARAKDSALPKPAVPLPTPQPEILTRENAFSTFSLNVSDVSFKLAAATLEKGQMPEPGAIRSEEFINAFDYRDPDAAPGVPVAFASERARYPFAHNRELLRFSLKTAAAGRQAGRPLNIVLLLDNSGSMERADRVSIIREALRVLAGQLQAGDTFSIVTFARTAQLRVDGIPGNQAGAAAEEIAKLTPEGGTNLGDALDLAYETARHHYLANGDNRVVLLTDGAANLGDVNADTLKQKVEAQRQQGIALDCFGIGWEGYNDDLLEVLTRNGDGRYGFINSPAEANTEFVAQIAGALHVAAADVKVQVEFNPQRVASYRQIGYAKHQLTKEQFRDNTVDAAEIAAQEAGNALYTIEINPEGSGSIGTVRVRYKVPGTAEYREQAWDVPYTGGAVALDQASPAMRLAATACAFSEWLATSPFAAEVSTDQLLQYMNGVPQFYGADGRPAKLEWMIRQAKSISGR